MNQKINLDCPICGEALDQAKNDPKYWSCCFCGYSERL